jgi:hypothetical protein
MILMDLEISSLSAEKQQPPERRFEMVYSIIYVM